MYRYEPKSKKKREKGLLFALLILAVALFGCAQIPNVFLPAVLQLLGVFCLVGVVMLISRYLLRSYAYSVEPSETAAPDAPKDLVITETYGNRVSVVCRISVINVESIREITPQNRKQIAAELKGKRVYKYAAELFPEDYHLLSVSLDEERFFIKLSADQPLISAIMKHSQQ